MARPRHLHAWLLAAALFAASAGPALAQTADLQRAWEALQRGDVDGALLLLGSAVSAGGLGVGDVGAAYNMRGLAHMKREDFANAEADFSVASTLIPDFVAAVTNRGLARAKLENYGAAIADFSRALELAPGEPEVLFMRGNARFDGGDPAGAAADYSLVIDRAPGHWMALMNRCDALGRLGRLDEARADCDRARPLAPDKAAVERIVQSLGAPCDCVRAP